MEKRSSSSSCRSGGSSRDCVSVPKTDKKGRRLIKLVCVGDWNVGKTSFLFKTASGVFPREYVPTHFDNYTLQLVFEHKRCLLDLWDTAGGEDYPLLRHLCFPGTDIFLLFFAVNSRESFEHVETEWVPELHHHCPDTPILLVGAKADLRKKPDPEGALVSREECVEMAARIGAVGHLECSSLEGWGWTRLSLRLCVSCLGNKTS